MPVSVHVMKRYVGVWAASHGLLDNVEIGFCSVWVENERRPAVRIFTTDLNAIYWLEHEPEPKPGDNGIALSYGTLKYYCEVGNYKRMPDTKAGLVRLYPTKINAADRAEDLANKLAVGHEEDTCRPVTK